MSERKIVTVSADLDSLEEISVELDNGVYLGLTLKDKMSNPLFAQIKELSQPKTDGDRVYWFNGASLTVDEIMDMLRTDKHDGKTKESER